MKGWHTWSAITLLCHFLFYPALACGVHYDPEASVKKRQPLRLAETISPLDSADVMLVPNKCSMWRRWSGLWSSPERVFWHFRRTDHCTLKNPASTWMSFRVPLITVDKKAGIQGEWARVLSVSCISPGLLLFCCWGEHFTSKNAIFKCLCSQHFKLLERKKTGR